MHLDILPLFLFIIIFNEDSQIIKIFNIDIYIYLINIVICNLIKIRKKIIELQQIVPWCRNTSIEIIFS